MVHFIISQDTMLDMMVQIESHEVGRKTALIYAELFFANIGAITKVGQIVFLWCTVKHIHELRKVFLKVSSPE